MNRIIKVGLDIGNSAVKGSVLSEQNSLMHDILIPSAINRIHDEKFLSYPERNTTYVQILSSPLEHANEIIAIGDRAMDIPNYEQYDVGATSHKTNHEITTSLLFGILAEAMHGSEEHIDVVLAVSVPIVESKTFHLVDNYQSMLQGEHVLRVYTGRGVRDVHVNIVLAKVINEGQAGFYGLLDTVDQNFKHTMDVLYQSLNEDSNAIRSLEDFLVIDIGEGTTDLAVFRKKKFNSEFSYSVTKGYGTLLEQAMSDAEREGLTIESRKQLQTLLSSDNSRRAEQRARWTSYVEAERKGYADHVVNTILKTYGRQSYFDAIIFLGGGFTALTGYRLDGNAAVMDNTYLFEALNKTLSKNNKSVGMLFGIPAPYSQSINNRGLMQVLSLQNPKRTA